MDIIEIAANEVAAQAQQANADSSAPVFPPVKYTVRDAEIADMKRIYSALVIEGENKEQYQVVRTARLDCKAKRVAVENTRKALKEDALVYGRLVDSEAKRLIAAIEAIEEPLKKMESEYERVEAERKAAIAREKVARLDRMASELAKYEAVCPPSVLSETSDEGFAVMLADAQTRFAERQAKAEAERQAQAAEMERQRAELAAQAERDRQAREEAERQLVAERQAQAERDAKANEERQAREAQLQAERQQAEEAARVAREEAARLRREADEKERAERFAREEAARVAADAERTRQAEEAKRVAEAQHEAAKRQAVQWRQDTEQERKQASDWLQSLHSLATNAPKLDDPIVSGSVAEVQKLVTDICLLANAGFM